MLQDPALGVAGEDDLDQRPGTRGVARIQPARSAAWLEEDIAARQAIGIDGQEEDVIAGRRSRLAGLTASSAGEAARPEVEDEPQSEALVRLLAAEGQDRALRRLVQDGRVGGRLTEMVQQPAFGDLASC